MPDAADRVFYEPGTETVITLFATPHFAHIPRAKAAAAMDVDYQQHHLRALYALVRRHIRPRRPSGTSGW